MPGIGGCTLVAISPVGFEFELGQGKREDGKGQGTERPGAVSSGLPVFMGPKVSGQHGRESAREDRGTWAENRVHGMETAECLARGSDLGELVVAGWGVIEGVVQGNGDAQALERC